MSTTEVQSREATGDPRARSVDMKLEVVVIPVSDADRAVKFYSSLGWRQDVTPPGLRHLPVHAPRLRMLRPVGRGTNDGRARDRSGAVAHRLRHPGRARQAKAAGVTPDEVFHFGASGKAAGVDPQRNSYRSFASFRDPDGNQWLFQEITTRLPGRIDSAATTFASASDLASAMRRAEKAHGEHEKRIGQRDAQWADWYAEYMVAEQSGKLLPS